MKRFISLLLIVVLIFALSSVAFAVSSPEKQNTDVDVNEDTEPSPTTADNNAIYFVVTALLLAVGTLVFCGKKLVNQK